MFFIKIAHAFHGLHFLGGKGQNITEVLAISGLSLHNQLLFIGYVSQHYYEIGRYF